MYAYVVARSDMGSWPWFTNVPYQEPDWTHLSVLRTIDPHHSRAWAGTTSLGRYGEPGTGSEEMADLEVRLGLLWDLKSPKVAQSRLKPPKIALSRLKSP